MTDLAGDDSATHDDIESTAALAPARRRRRAVVEAALVSAFYTVVAVIALWPMPIKPFAGFYGFGNDNLGGDELSMAYTILVVGMIAFAGAAVALVWAIRAGQFSNVEDPKYTMLENAPDLDDLPMIFGEDRPLVRPRQKQPQPKAAGQRLAGSAGQRRE